MDLGGFPLTEKNPQTSFDPLTIQKQKFWIWDLSLIWFCVQTNKYLKENSISELHHDWLFRQRQVYNVYWSSFFSVGLFPHFILVSTRVAICCNLQERISQSALSRYTKLMTMKLLRGIIYIFLPQQLFTNSPAVCIAYQALLGIRRFCKPSPPSVRLWRSKRSNLRKQKREESLSLYLF